MNPEEIIIAFENGERELDHLLEKMGWKSWLGVAELGLVMNSNIVDFLQDKLSLAETKVLDLVKQRIAGNITLESIEEALVVARNPESRDLALEGRLRMERGLVHFENGDIEVIDLVSRESTVIHRTGGAMRHLTGNPETGILYASELGKDYILSVDTATDEVEIFAYVDNVPNTIDLSPDGKVLYVSSRGRNNPESYHLIGPEWGSIAVIDTATGDYLDAIIGGNQPTGLDVSPDGTMLAYSDFLDHRVTVYQIPPYEELRNGNGGRWEAHLSEIVK